MGCPTHVICPDSASYQEMGRTTYAAMAGGERSDLTWQLRKGDGSLFWGRMIGRALDPASPDEGSVWMLEDITDQKNAEQERLSLEVQLRHAQKLEAIGQLAAGIAHEINTPTQYIGDNTKFLAEAFQDVFRVMDAQDGAMEGTLAGAPMPENLRAIREEADLPFLRAEIPKAIEQSLEGIARVTKIVRAMKDFSHPGSEEPVEVDLNRSIESTITVCRNEWKYVADLVLDLDPALGTVLCFPNEMNQAVLNLVVNAAHAIAETLPAGTDAKGTLTVSTARSATMAEIRVRDTGSGIPEHVRSRIFDPFFTTKAVGKGTGQGLAIVHTVVVERHKGAVAFETELGKGSVFILRIPLAGPAQ
jgi:signal transduction histidine kinase